MLKSIAATCLKLEKMLIVKMMFSKVTFWGERDLRRFSDGIIWLLSRIFLRNRKKIEEENTNIYRGRALKSKLLTSPKYKLKRSRMAGREGWNWWGERERDLNWDWACCVLLCSISPWFDTLLGVETGTRSMLFFSSD